TALATIGKPVSESELAEKLELFRLTSSTSKTI
ncbi:response regulator, partial [Sinorhizobium meliloti]|nr:response regulator [Sinorhizobium meliloti]MDW9979825.1 response regulator [Sinorhizobium meliloti]MDX0296766.1 response regulator [Sinorhizobium meliloti]